MPNSTVKALRISILRALEFRLLSLGNMAVIGRPQVQADTFIMVRTVCCEGYKQCGNRCAICPNRPENRQAVRDYKEREMGRLHSLGISHPSASEYPPVA